MNLKFILAGLALIAILPMAGAAGPGSSKTTPKKEIKKKVDTDFIVVGGGCFWCVETVFESLKGVVSVESGYAGGTNPGVTYDEVCSGNSGHAEVVKVTYNKNEISADHLMKVFFTVHDPTTLNAQGPDHGTQYRSVIFFRTDAEKLHAHNVIKEVTAEHLFRSPITTTVEPLKNYTRAEEYHQNYFAKYEKATDAERARMNGGYCRAIIEPKVRKFREKYAGELKKN